MRDSTFLFMRMPALVGKPRKQRRFTHTAARPPPGHTASVPQGTGQRAAERRARSCRGAAAVELFIDAPSAGSTPLTKVLKYDAFAASSFRLPLLPRWSY